VPGIPKMGQYKKNYIKRPLVSKMKICLRTLTELTTFHVEKESQALMH